MLMKRTMRIGVLSVAAVGLLLSASPSSADVFPPSKFPLTSYARCDIAGERVNLSMSYRVAAKDSSRREIGKVYVSGPLTDGVVRARATDAVSGATRTASSKGTYRGFSANADFQAHGVSAGSVVAVRISTDAGSCAASMSAK